MKYFVNEKERKQSNTTCYFEFQKGKYNGKCWRDDSVCISDGLWDEYGLSELLEKVVPDFDYYGTTEINRAQWNEIVRESKDMQSKCACVIDDVAEWVENCLKTYVCFTILGM